MIEKYDTIFTVASPDCLRQSYEGVEGDSASSTELCRLSAWQKLLIKQGIAVTIVNQKGEVQAIGE
jgi:predicted ATP-dependent protease